VVYKTVRHSEMGIEPPPKVGTNLGPVRTGSARGSVFYGGTLEAENLMIVWEDLSVPPQAKRLISLACPSPPLGTITAFHSCSELLIFQYIQHLPPRCVLTAHHGNQ
jgi:hypothetical protein